VREASGSWSSGTFGREISVSTIRPNLAAFTGREDLVFVVDRFNAIEDRVTEILTQEIGAPKERERFVRDILFNNAIVSFAAKVKLFSHIRSVRGWPTIDAKDFHRLMHIRNQFAHCNPRHHIRITLDEQHGATKVEPKLMLESLSNKGQLVPVETSAALQEFTEIYDRLKTYLLGVSKLAEPSAGGNAAAPCASA